MKILIIIIAQAVLSYLVAEYVGRGRKIGFWGSFIVCLIISPIFGGIATLMSSKEK
jgi:hypothetical protein